MPASRPWQEPFIVAPIAALGGGLDDWPRLISLLNSLAYRGRVELLPVNGPFQCKSKHATASGAWLRGRSGVEIVASLGVTLDVFNAPFNANVAVTSATTLNVQNSIGTNTIRVDSLLAGGIAPGAQIEVSTADGLRALIYTVEAVSGAGPFDLVLDRITLMTWPATSPVSLLASAPSDIILEGGGAVISGVCDRFIELAGAQRCVVDHWDLVSPATAHNDLMASFDIAGRGNRGTRIRAFGGGGRTLGIAQESDEGGLLQDCFVTGTTGEALVFLDCVGCEMSRVTATGNADGIALSADGNTLGCYGCRVTGANASGNTGKGVIIGNGSSFCKVQGVTCDDCDVGTFVDGSAGTPVGNVLSEVSALRPGTTSHTLFGGLSTTYSQCIGGRTVGFNLTWNLQGPCTLAACETIKGIVSEGDGGVFVGNTSKVRIVGGDFSPYYGNALQVGAGSKATCVDVTLACTDVSFGVANVSGTAILRDIEMAGGSTGIQVQTGGVVRREDVDTAACTTDSSVAPGGTLTGFDAAKWSFGASSSLTNAAAQTVYPGSQQATVLAATDALGIIVAAPDVLSSVTVKHTGDALNVAGQQVVYDVLVNGASVATVTIAANASTTTTTQLGTAVVLAVGDIVRVTATPSAALTAAVKDVQASIG